MVENIKNNLPGMIHMLRLPAFTGWICLSSGIVIGYYFLPGLKSIVYLRFVFLSILALFIAAVLISRPVVRNLSLLICGILLIMHQRSGERIAYAHCHAARAIETTVKLSGTVASPPVPSYGAYRFIVRADSISTPENGSCMKGKSILCISEKPPVSPGKILCRGTFTTPRPQMNPGAYDEYAVLRSKGVWGKFYIERILEDSACKSPAAGLSRLLRNHSLAALSHIRNLDNRAILQAAFLGERHMLTTTIKKIFSEAGMYHLLAISGLHVAIIASFIYTLLFIFPLNKAAKTIITLVFIWSYLFFIGFIPSLFRAVVMISVFLSSMLFQRQNQSLNSLGLAGIFWLFLSPSSLVTPGFQLSFAATFAIIALTPIFKEIIAPVMRTPTGSLSLGLVQNAACVMIAGFIGTAPILACHFGRLSLFGLASNIVSVLLMSWCMYSFFLGLVFQLVSGAAAWAILRISEISLSSLVFLAGLSQKTVLSTLKVSCAFPEIIAGYAGVVAVFIWSSKKKRIRFTVLAVSAFLLIVPCGLLVRRLDKTLHITFFNDRAGLIAGIQWPNRKLWLVGTGARTAFSSSYRMVLSPWFRRCPHSSLDAVIPLGNEKNPVHSLEPLCTNHSPGNIYTPDNQRKNSFGNVISPLAKEFNVSLKKVRTQTRFIPAPSCTCSILCTTQ
ncbi:MAG: DUF4131 domain-containing protein [Chitinivibrionales bacterium]|nr:DUF4131 domain-containing protein [Chitinivibrionales bacterium]